MRVDHVLQLDLGQNIGPLDDIKIELEESTFCSGPCVVSSRTLIDQNHFS